MTEAFWWYLLAGFIVGFTLSTMWEWLYFRRRRMRIENRRIAELETMLRTYAAAEASQAPATGSHDTWSTPPFDDPGAYLDIEDAAAVSAAPPADLPPMRVTAPQGNGNRNAPSTAAPSTTLPHESGTRSAPAVAAATVTAAAIASSRTQPPAQTAVTASPPQAYASPRSSTFPTAAAQTAPPPVSKTQPPPTTHTIPNGLTAHYPSNDPPAAPFPSAAAQPAPASAPLALAAKPVEAPPPPETTDDYTQAGATDERNPRAAIALGTAGTAVALAATRPQEEESAAQKPADEPTAGSPAGTATALAMTRSQVEAPVTQEAADESAVEPAADTRSPIAPTATSQHGTMTSPPAVAEPAGSEAAPPPATGTANLASPAQAVTAPEALPRAPEPTQATTTAATSQPAADTPDRSGAGLAAAAMTAVAANEARERKQAGNTDTANINGVYRENATGASAAQPVGAPQSTEATGGQAPRPAEESTIKDEAPITPARIDALVASIHELIEAVNQERTGNVAETAALMAVAGQLEEEKTVRVETPRAVVAPEPALGVNAAAAEPTSRIEEALVLLIKSVGRFIRQMRSIFSGEGGQAPQIQRAMPGGTLLTINGMTQQHIDRLRVAGITSPTDLARLSETELRMLLLAPGGETSALDYSAWLKQAGEIAGGGKRAVES